MPWVDFTPMKPLKPISAAAALVVAAKNHELFVVVPRPNEQAMPVMAAQWWTKAHAAMARPHHELRMLHAGGFEARLIDQVAPDAAMLIQLSAEQRLLAQTSRPDLRIEPAALASPLWARNHVLSRPSQATSGSGTKTQVQVVDASSGEALANVDVYGYTNVQQQEGVTARTNRHGIATLPLAAGNDRFEAITAQPDHSFWPTLCRNAVAGDAQLIACTRIAHTRKSIVKQFGLEGLDHDGEGVRVGVIDTGIDSEHPDLRVEKSKCTISSEDPNDGMDAMGHGTHVAGLIAGRAEAGKGVRGVAPGCTLYGYRVFGRGADYAVSLHIAKAIRLAVEDGCDLINLSLGAEQDMPEVWREIQRARSLGVVCLAATGNDYRAPVSYPARYSPVLAVSAFGRKGVYPQRAAQALSQAKPLGAPDRRNFMASFSNVGPEVKLTGPGVGVVSCFTNGRYAVMDGTSMACPLVTGALARRLAKDLTILAMPRDEARWTAISSLALGSAQQLGFGLTFEGSGHLA